MGIRINSHRIRQASYAPILAVAMTIMFVRLLIMARVLDVSAFAELSAILIVSGVVGMLAGCGLFLDFQRKLPGQLALGQRRLAATYMWSSIIGALAVGLFGFLLAGLRITSGGITPDVVIFGVIHGVSQQIFLIVTTESRSNNEPLRFSVQSLSRSIGLIILAVPAAYILHSAKSAILAESFATMAVTLAVFRKVSYRLPINSGRTVMLAVRSLRFLNWRSIGTLLLLSVAGACSTNLDRWLSSTYLQPVEFAQYSFAWITLTAAFAVQSLVNASIFPMIARRSAIYGIQSAFRLSALAAFGMLAVFLISIIPAVYSADLAIGKLYPNYVMAMPLIPILAIAAAFRISDFWSSFLVINGKEETSLAINVGINIFAVGIWATTRFGAGSISLSLAYLAAFSAIGTYLLSFFYSYKHYRGKYA